jgi:hypothetical protein
MAFFGVHAKKVTPLLRPKKAKKVGCHRSNWQSEARLSAFGGSELESRLSPAITKHDDDTKK